MPNNSVFNMFWHGDRLSALETICMQSFVDHKHTLRVFTYANIELPPGIVIEDAGQILPFSRFFTFEGSSSAFSNIFRYKVLLEQGGWWVDTDVLCLKDELPACEYYWAEEHPGQINGAILKFPVRDPMCSQLFHLSEQESNELTHWGQLGPELLTKALSDNIGVKHWGSTTDAILSIGWKPTLVGCPSFDTRWRREAKTQRPSLVAFHVHKNGD
jgi:hypothetical protein